MDEGEFLEAARDIMSRADMLTLSTEGDGEYPYVRALFNLRNAGQFPALAPRIADERPLRVYLGTNSSSLKARQIGAEPKVSVYYMIPGEFKGLMLCGEAAIDEAAREWLWVDGWERYYPQGRRDPDYRVFRIDPVLARGWYGGFPFEFKS